MRLRTIGHLVLVVLAPLFLMKEVRGQSVDPLTGRAIVNLPLGSVSAFDLSVSVNLSHSGGALRVNEGPGSAGMGWSVVAGGSISREVRGLPDDVNTPTQHGWLYNGSSQTIQNFNSTSDNDPSTCTDESADWSFLNTTLGYAVDPEPDVFYFQAPGISGKFIFDATGTPQLIPYQDLKITYSVSLNAILTFTIKTNNGMVYTFNAGESVLRQATAYSSSVPVSAFLSDYTYFQGGITFSSKWDLSSIQSGATGTTAFFNYTNGEQENSFRYLSLIKPTYTTSADTLYYIKDVISPTNLTQVTLKNYSVNIAWTNSLVDKVTITESETGETKEYDLVYKSIASNSDNQLFPKISKPFLTAVKQQNSCIAYPSYLFNYEGVDTTASTVSIPWRTGWGEDHFGYNNGQTTNRNIPTIYFYSTETGARRFRVTRIAGLSPEQPFPGVAGSNKDVNPATVTYGTLIGIAYPTGGYTSFTYEPNKYFDSSTGEELFGPGVRVASISTSGGETAFGKPTSGSKYHVLTKSYQYTGTGTLTSGRILYPPVFAFTEGTSVFRSQTDLGPGVQVMYGKVTELIPGQGSRIYYYDIPNAYPDATANATPSKVARSSNSVCAPGLFNNGAYSWPFAPLTDLDFMRGYLTKVQEFSESAQLTLEKRMTYITPQTGSILKGLRFESILDAQGYPIFFYSQYLIPIGQSRILSQEVHKVMADVSLDGFTSDSARYQYNAKNMVTQTTQTNDDGSVLSQYVKYAMDYNITSPVTTDGQAVAISKLNATNRYSEVIETYQMFTPIGGVATVTGAGLNIFKDYGSYVWPYQQKQFPQGLAFASSYASTGGTQGFVADPKYILSNTVDYSSGLPINQVGVSLIPSGTHYSTGTGMPLASLVNCRAENAVYEGFEMTSSRGLSVVGTPPTLVTGWTGAKAMPLTSSISLISGTTIKSENTYRISLWANAPTAADVKIQVMNGATEISNVVLHYGPTALNTWVYLEGTIAMSAVAVPFTWRVTNLPAAMIIIDDFVAIPSSSRISSQTFLPLTGMTSQTDDRGNSSKFTYDVMGRKVNTMDRKRNLVELKEYQLQRQGVVSLNANFTSSATNYTSGQSVTFTAASTCLSNVNYAWQITDVTGHVYAYSTSSVNFTFSVYGAHSIQLTASKFGYTTVVFTDNICVNPGSFSITVNLTGSGIYNAACAIDNGSRTFTAAVLGPGKGGWNLTYVWWISDQTGNIWSLIPGAPNVTSVSGNTLVIQSPAYTYQVKCIATAGLATTALASFECKVNQPSAVALNGIIYQNNPLAQCQ